jgi:hypothetical protein
MKRFCSALALTAALATSGCSSLGPTAARVEPALTTACNDAIGIANIAGLVPGVGAIVPYITAGCATAEGLAKLAADPKAIEWVGELRGQVKGLAAGVGLKL